MNEREAVDELFRSLLSGAVARVQAQHQDPKDSQQLLSAFRRIEDPRLRRELVVLVELVSQMPELIQRRLPAWDGGDLAHVH